MLTLKQRDHPDWCECAQCCYIEQAQEEVMEENRSSDMEINVFHHVDDPSVFQEARRLIEGQIGRPFPGGVFHLQNGLCFARLDTDTVVIIWHGNITWASPNGWASVVASVSRRGENGATFDEAIRLHSISQEDKDTESEHPQEHQGALSDLVEAAEEALTALGQAYPTLALDVKDSLRAALRPFQVKS